MKTKKRTRLSFSGNKLDITLPTGWADFTDAELKGVYAVMASHPVEQVPAMVFRCITGVRVMGSIGNDWILRFPVGGGDTEPFVKISNETLAEYVSTLDFITGEPGNVPVRPAMLHGRTAVDARLHDVPFGKYIELENAFQAYLQTRNPGALCLMMDTVYPGGKATEEVTDADALLLLNWMAQLKNLFALTFPNFFRPGAGSPSHVDMLQVMNNEIRALTGGDVTKEQVVLDTDCWRALTELDFKAKEAAEFEKMKP